MFLRCKVRRKDGKQHRYWSVVENTRVAGGRVVQRHVLYLGEINDTEELAWRRSIEVLEDGAARPRTLSLFLEDRVQGLLADASIVGVRLSELRLHRPRQWGACWLALMLWHELQLDQFWSKRLGVSRKGTHWDERSEEHTSELQSPDHLVCRLLLEKKKKNKKSKYRTREIIHGGDELMKYLQSYRHRRPCVKPYLHR